MRGKGGALVKAVTSTGTLPLFDERPIEVPGFRFRSRSVVIIGRPKLEEFENAFTLAMAFSDSAAYWVGDLMRYAEGRSDWTDKLSQVMSLTGLARQTILNYTSTCNRVDEETRAIAPTPKHAEVVAPLPKVDQVRLLEKASTEGWTVRDLNNTMRSERRRRVIEGQAVLEGMYRVVYADPPWLYGDRQASGSSAQTHYPGMSIDELCQLPVQAHVTPDAVLWLWCTTPMLLVNPGPREVLEAWGFVYKTARVWDKVSHGWGHYVDVRHEHLLICTRGSCLPDRLTPMLESVVVERRSEVHSEKPDSFRKDIERLYDGPRIELFGRERVDGWHVLGNDPALWSSEVEEQGHVTVGTF